MYIIPPCVSEQPKVYFLHITMAVSVKSMLSGTFVCFWFLTGCEGGQKARLVIKVNHQFEVSRISMKAGATLRLSCEVKFSEGDPDDFKVSWTLPSQIEEGRRNYSEPKRTSLSMSLRDLKKSDSGNYTCHASSSHYTNSTVFILNVVSGCGVKKFECNLSNVTKCIDNQFVCDGRSDCNDSEDESPQRCGTNVCDGKIFCEGRCVWCCRNSTNCTYDYSPSCCQHHFGSLLPSQAHIDISIQDRDLSFLKSTVYTVIGCALGFVLIVTIAVIAVCRAQMTYTRRRVQCHYATPSPAYVMDYPTERIRIHCSISNGFQIIGRPVSPPPYCEIVQIPPEEGPPPPYESRENLAVANNNEDINGNSAPDLEEARDKSVH